MAPPQGVFYPPSPSRQTVTNFKIFVFEENTMHTLTSTPTPCQYNYGFWLLLVHVLLHDCSCCTIQVLMSVAETTGTHTFVVTKPVLMQLLNQASIRSWDYMVKLFHKARHVSGLIDEQIACETCLYCNRPECEKHHFDLKLISLLHQKNVWFKMTNDMHLSFPFFSYQSGQQKVRGYYLVFVLHKSPSVPVLVMVKGIDTSGRWNGPFQTSITKKFKQVVWNCPVFTKEFPSLFQCALSSALRNNQTLPDVELPNKNLQELNGIWNTLKTTLHMVLKL